MAPFFKLLSVFVNISVGLPLAVLKCFLWQATKQNPNEGVNQQRPWLQKLDIVLEDVQVWGFAAKE